MVSYMERYRLIFFQLINECLKTPQHNNDIGYWMSDKGMHSMFCCLFVVLIFFYI